jgi:hypothetical protein
MDLLIEGLTSDFDLEKFISAYAKKFSIESLEDGNKIVIIPHEISPLMIIDLLNGCKINCKLITLKKIKQNLS